jgi:NADPH:quinone reductase-like Zn-dependent oxidoreductase
MRAVVRDRFGIGALELAEVAKPEPEEGQVLVRVRASSINRADWYGVVGAPWVARPMMGIRRPKDGRPGSDLAGVVEAVGEGVTEVAPGDEVYGLGDGTYGEFAIARKALDRKPAGVSFEEAAAVPLAALTALQGLRDHAGLKPGQKVLVNGASGGVGTFAVQIAKALGADVTAVCSTRNVDQARELGADRVLDYTREDFTRSGERFDVIFDNAGTRGWRACKRVLADDGIVVLVGGPHKRLLGPLGHVAGMLLRGRKRTKFFVAKPNREDLAALRELMEAGKVRPVVERVYPLDEIRDAFRHHGEGHSRGKLVVSVAH